MLLLSLASGGLKDRFAYSVGGALYLREPKRRSPLSSAKHARLPVTFTFDPNLTPLPNIALSKRYYKLDTHFHTSPLSSSILSTLNSDFKWISTLTEGSGSSAWDVRMERVGERMDGVCSNLRGSAKSFTKANDGRGGRNSGSDSPTHEAMEGSSSSSKGKDTAKISSALLLLDGIQSESKMDEITDAVKLKVFNAT